MIGNMKTAYKIIGYGIIMTLIIVIVGLTGYYYNIKSTASLNAMYEEHLIAVQVLNDSRNQMRAAESDTAQLLISQDPAHRAAVTADIEKRAKAVDANFATFEKTGIASEEKQILETVKKQLSEYRSIRTKILKLSGEGKVSEAWSLFLASDKLWEDIQGGVRNLSEISVEDARKANEENQVNAQKASAIMSAIAIFAAFLAIYLGLYISNMIVKPLKVMVSYAEAMAEGELRDVARTFVRKDELGQLADALIATRASLRGLMKQIADNAEQLAASSEELSASSEQSAQASNQVAESITDVAAGAAEQMNVAKETSTVVEHMSTSIEQVALNVHQAAGQSNKTADKAKEGGKTVDRAVSQMTAIGASTQMVAKAIEKLDGKSKEIGQIVDTISNIAGQTNLLALNAAIEAARAGEQGRGFTVVAEEVRKLAEGSQNAAKKISGLIAEIQSDTQKAVDSMAKGAQEVKIGTEVVAEAGTAFKEISDLVNEVSEQVRNISAAIQQMAGGSQQIVVSVKKIDVLSKKSTGEAQSVSAATQEQLASIEEIATSSESLAKLAQELKSAVSRFSV